jgi:DNA-binding NarL/FixJ family response regulator
MEKLMNRVSIVLIEDHHLTRVGIKAALEDCEEIKFIAEASNGLQGITLLEKTLPDVAIIDLGLPGLVDGIELTKRFKEYVQTRQLDSSISQPKVLILTSQDQEESILAAFAAGADSYCMKDLKFEKLLEAILETHRGANWIDPSIARIVLARLNNPFKEVVASSAIPTVSIHGLKPEDNELLQSNPLTRRENEIIELIVEGYGNEEIAEQLFISMGTVKTHVRNILNKLACDDRTQAAVRALRAGLVS